MTTKTPPDHESLGIDPYEKNWIKLSITLIVLFGIAIAVAGFALGYQLPGVEQRVNPQTVAKEGPFAQPGLREIAPGEYEAYIVAQTWSYDPRTIEVPVGSTITFYVTSIDVQHGFKIQDTNINFMAVPGQVSKLTATFDTPGEFPYICTEYCGLGHAAMFGRVRVVEPGQEGGGS